MKNKDVVFFFTGSYPYGNGEAFIEREIPFLKKNFDKVIIISGSPKNNQKIREIPIDVELINIPYDYENVFISVLKPLTSFSVYNEIFTMLFLHKKTISLGRIKTIFLSHINSLRLKKLYINEIDKLRNSHNIFLYNFWYNDTTIAISKIKKKLSVFTISRAHRWDLYFEENKYNYLPFRSSSSKNIDLISSASINGINYFREGWKIPNHENLTLSRLGVKVQKIGNFNNNTIVSCSNIIPVKRVKKIIETLCLVKTKKVTWIHFGEGENMSLIKNLATKKLPENISFEFLGHIDNSRLLAWYKANSPALFINLSLSEGIPVSIMEAMSFGIPCLATCVGGVEELVTSESGFPVPKDIQDIDAAKIIDNYLRLSFNDRKKIMLKSCKHISLYFNADKNYSEFCSKIKKLKD